LADRKFAERRQEKARAESGLGTVPSTGTDSPSAQGTPNPGSTVLPGFTPTSILVDDPDAPPPGTQAPGGADGDGAENYHKAPGKRYKLNDEMKRLIWELVCLSNECVRLENEKNELEGNKGKDLSEQGFRKNLYQKVRRGRV
jgi:hypothetical protein